MSALRQLSVLLLAAWLPALLSSCGGGGGSGEVPAPVTTVSGNGTPASADITIAYFGNSHTAVNDVPGMVAAMLRAGEPARTVASTVSPDWLFLNERGDHEPSLSLLRSQRWSFVVLQAQNYSSSGQFVYPTLGAQKLVNLSRTQGAVPILFAEWPRRGIAETPRILDVYTSIAMNAPACVPPIPQSFDVALARHPDLTLHAADGNHSAPPGAFLAALILYATMSGRDVAALPTLSIGGVDADTQAKLRAVAADTLRAYPAKQWCPND